MAILSDARRSLANHHEDYFLEQNWELIVQGVAYLKTLKV